MLWPTKGGPHPKCGVYPPGAFCSRFVALRMKSETKYAAAPMLRPSHCKRQDPHCGGLAMPHLTATNIPTSIGFH